MCVPLRTSVVVAFIASANLASAGPPHAAIGRYFGLGSGPGYHAYNNCPTPPRHGHPGYVYGGHDSTWQDALVVQPVETLAPPRAVPQALPQPKPARPEASSRRPSEPQLPSQRMSQQPVFWYK